MAERLGWRALLDAAEAAPDAELRFEMGGRTMRRGLHVTEVRRASVDAIDCGLGRRDWEEAQIELLAFGIAPMRGATLARLLRRSASALDLEPDMPLVVEASPGSGGLRRYHVGAVEGDGRHLRVELKALRAACRPSRTTGCCGSRIEAACCG